FDESLSLVDTVSKTINVSLDESLSLEDVLSKTIIVSFDESLDIDDQLSKSFSVSFDESLSLVDNINRSISVIFTESIPISDGIIDLTFVGSVSFTETLSILDDIDSDHAATFSLSDTLDLSSSETEYVNLAPDQILIEDAQPTEIVTEDDKQLVVTNSNATLSLIELHNVQNVTMSYADILVINNVTINNGWIIDADVDDSIPTFDVKVQVADSTNMTGPAGWNGILELPTFTPITIPDTETETFSEITAIEVGLSSGEITFDKPVRIEFTGDGGNKGFDIFFKRAGDPSVTFIDTVCTADNLATVKAQLGGAGECVFDDGTNLSVWTTHFTAFGAAKRSSTSSAPSAPSGSSGVGSGGGGGTGGAGGTGGFGGILGTPLAINEVSYDRCDVNMARILVSSDADEVPTVVLHTTMSGTVYATLAAEQPFADLNQFTKVDKYVFEAPIASDETFMMVVLSEIKGEVINRVQSPVYLTSCTGSTTIVELPEEEEEVSFDVPRIFDMKFQIDNGTMHKAESESELFYLDGQDLTVTAIVDSKSPLGRVELRTATLGAIDEEYIAIRMNVDPMIVSNSTSFVSATIPSHFMVEPGVKYWIHVLDEDLNSIDSTKYEIGVKPTTVPTVSVEMDVPTVKASGASIKPEVYIFTNNATAYGLVSLIADGEIVSQRTQLFEAGQTKVTFDWNIPKSDSYASNELQGKVDLYDGSVITESATIHSHPRTTSISVSELPSLELIEVDGQVVAEPALIYSSNSDENLQFRVTDPQGQCVIGGTDDCTINESTRENRGGLTSIMYDGQVLRVRYSGADNTLERFSITSIDPITGQWNVSVETEDGFIQQAHAIEDISVKIKYRYHSETITAFSK
ncbi:MAG: hypothetical protein ACE5DT_01720, partial [Nitrosopumilus sp.]